MKKSVMQKFDNFQNRKRLGAVAVECALVVPLLVLAVMGMIDVGQFVNVGQVVNNASREGARHAARLDVTTVSEVQDAVESYLEIAFPDANPTSATVTVKDGSGNTIPGGDLTTLASGSQVSVTVSFPYDSVRWANGFPTLSGKTLKTTTVMRRE
ncbi:MAG: hypothetical protein Tsb009_08850 [Planctomycetaceae bacterium]